jgi:hypothetical protein
VRHRHRENQRHRFIIDRMKERKKERKKTHRHPVTERPRTITCDFIMVVEKSKSPTETLVFLFFALVPVHFAE